MTGVEVKNAVKSWINERPPDFFISGMKKIVYLWDKCIERNKDYVEKLTLYFIVNFVYFLDFFVLS